jgi:hypothetical protein
VNGTGTNGLFLNMQLNYTGKFVICRLTTEVISEATKESGGPRKCCVKCLGVKSYLYAHITVVD